MLRAATGAVLAVIAVFLFAGCPRGIRRKLSRRQRFRHGHWGARGRLCKLGLAAERR